jgi:hypothetical protein
MRRAAIVLVVLAMVAGLGVFVVSQLYSLRVPFLTDTCRAFDNGESVRLDPDQMGHAATITAIAVRRHPNAPS